MSAFWGTIRQRNWYLPDQGCRFFSYAIICAKRRWSPNKAPRWSSRCILINYKSFSIDARQNISNERRTVGLNSKKPAKNEIWKIREIDWYYTFACVNLTKLDYEAQRTGNGYQVNFLKLSSGVFQLFGITVRRARGEKYGFEKIYFYI